MLDDYVPKTLIGKYSKRSIGHSFPHRHHHRGGGSTASTFDEADDGGDLPPLTIQAADMPAEMQRAAVVSAAQAIRLHVSEKRIAESIKQDFDRMYRPTWHCVVGRNWGSCVTHSKQCYVRLACGDMTVLLYRST